MVWMFITTKTERDSIALNGLPFNKNAIGCRCGACFADAGRYECSKCGFRCCGRCWQKRRPAAAILRVCLREGLVPLEDAKTGAKFFTKLQFTKKHIQQI